MDTVSTPLPQTLSSFEAQLEQAVLDWLHSPDNQTSSRLQQIKQTLCQQLSQQNISKQRIAQLAGVSEPTLRKILSSSV